MLDPSLILEVFKELVKDPSSQEYGSLPFHDKKTKKKIKEIRKRCHNNPKLDEILEELEKLGKDIKNIDEKSLQDYTNPYFLRLQEAFAILMGKGIPTEEIYALVASATSNSFNPIAVWRLLVADEDKKKKALMEKEKKDKEEEEEYQKNMKRILAGLRKRLNVLYEDIKNRYKTYHQIISKIKSLETESRINQHKIAGLKSTITALERNLEADRKNIDELKGVLGALKNKEEDLKLTVEAESEKIKGLKEEKKAMVGQVRSLKDRLIGHGSLLHTLRTMLASEDPPETPATISQRIVETERMHAEDSERVVQLEHELAENEVLLERAQKDAQVAWERLAEVKKEVNAQEGEIVQAEQDLAATIALVKESEQELASVVTRQAEIAEEIGELQVRLEEERKVIEAKELEELAIANDANGHGPEGEALREEINLRRLERDLENRKSELQILEDSAREFDAKVRKQEKDILELERELVESTSSRARRDTEVRIREKRNSLILAIAEAGSISQELEAKKEEIQNLETQLRQQELPSTSQRFRLADVAHTLQSLRENGAPPEAARHDSASVISTHHAPPMQRASSLLEVERRDDNLPPPYEEQSSEEETRPPHYRP